MKSKVFQKAKPLIGVLQLLPLPGSMGWKGKLAPVIARAEQEAAALATGGVDAILVENTGDAPYTHGRMDTAGAIAMGLIIRRVMHFTNLPIGVNVLENDPETALAIAMSVNAAFLRVTLLTGAAVTTGGVLNGKYRELARYRQQLQADGIAVFADISLDRALPNAYADDPINGLESLAREALDQGGADALIITDPGLSAETLQQVSYRLDAPVLYHYAHPLHQVSPYFKASDGLVVSAGIKKAIMPGQVDSPTVDLTKVEELIALTDILAAEAGLLV